MADSRRRRSVGGQGFLANQPELWRRIFPLDARRARFIAGVIGGAGRSVLDVGCATGDLCGALAAAGLRATGVDLNPSFVRAATVAFPGLRFEVADMRSLAFRSRFDGVACVGSTLLYADSQPALLETLRGFHAALRRGGRLVVDVLNASALIARRPFRRRTVHRFSKLGLTATIRHDVDEAAQALTERVTWTSGRRRCQDPTSRLRLLFPLELKHLLEGAGLRDVTILGDFRRDATRLQGRRMVALARRPQRGFRSVGYRGVAHREVDPATKAPVPGLYPTGWIKRGPSSVIGTNKPDSVETAASMVEDLAKGALLAPESPDPARFEALVRAKRPGFFSFADWRRLDEIEVARGKEVARPRVKFTSREGMAAALGR